MSETSNLQSHYWRECYYPLPDYSLRLEGHYNSIGVFHYDMTDGSYNIGATTSFSDGLRVEPTTVMLRGGVKRQTPSILPAPLPKAHYKAQNYGTAIAWLKDGKAGARALHYDYDYYDYSQRESRVGDDRKTRRLRRQELQSW